MQHFFHPQHVWRCVCLHPYPRYLSTTLFQSGGELCHCSELFTPPSSIPPHLGGEGHKGKGGVWPRSTTSRHHISQILAKNITFSIFTILAQLIWKLIFYWVTLWDLVTWANCDPHRSAFRIDGDAEEQNKQYFTTMKQKGRNVSINICLSLQCICLKIRRVCKTESHKKSNFSGACNTQFLYCQTLGVPPL